MAITRYPYKKKIAVWVARNAEEGIPIDVLDRECEAAGYGIDSQSPIIAAEFWVFGRSCSGDYGGEK